MYGRAHALRECEKGLTVPSKSKNKWKIACHFLSTNSTDKGHGHSSPLQHVWFQATSLSVEPSHILKIQFLFIVWVLAWMSLLQKSLFWPPDQIRPLPVHCLLDPVFLHSTHLLVQWYVLLPHPHLPQTVNSMQAEAASASSLLLSRPLHGTSHRRKAN